jgi:hypothetical protein
MRRFDSRLIIAAIMLAVIVFIASLLAFPESGQSLALLLALAAVVIVGVVGVFANARQAFEIAPATEDGASDILRFFLGDLSEDEHRQLRGRLQSSLGSPRSPKDVNALREVARRDPDHQKSEAAYAVAQAAELALAQDDYQVLARRLRSKQTYRDPLRRAEREEPLYVPMPLRFSRQRRPAPDRPFETDRDFDDILKAVDAPQAGPGSAPFPALVLLGVPGGGKSTALRHLALHRFGALLGDPDEKLPLFVSLGGYKDDALSNLRAARGQALQLTPLNFLRAHWFDWFGDDGFPRALAAGRLWLILDGLNEIPDRDRRVFDWADFFDREKGDFDYEAPNPAGSPPSAPPQAGPRVDTVSREARRGNRAIVACRRADYGNWLDLPSLDLKRLDPGLIRDFVDKRLARLGPAAIDDVMRRLEDDADLLDLAGNPFWLKLLADYADTYAGELPKNRAALIAWSVTDWLRRESGRADMPRLPDKEAKALQDAIDPFAYWMLEQGENSWTAWPEACACCGDWRGHDDKADALRRAEAASLLERQRFGDDESPVRFYHQLLLEYFAGRDLARRFREGESQAARWRIPWANWSFVHSEWQRLSGPPTTGWEEATVFAAAQDDVDIDAFTRAVLIENPPLAARCILELESGRAVSEETRQAALERLRAIVERRDPALDEISEASARLSLRIAAGHALGKLGDPRIINDKTHGRVILSRSPDPERSEGEGAAKDLAQTAEILRRSAAQNDMAQEVEFIEPDWCPVEAGPFTMGSDTSPYRAERRILAT